MHLVFRVLVAVFERNMATKRPIVAQGDIPGKLENKEQSAKRLQEKVSFKMTVFQGGQQEKENGQKLKLLLLINIYVYFGMGRR